MQAPQLSTERNRSAFVINADDRAILDRIVAPSLPQEKHGIVVNEGMRLVSFGKTGSGKTSLMRAVVYYMLIQKLARFALIHDTKGIFPEYRKSLQVANVAEFTARGGFRSGDIPLVSFRGNAREDVTVSAEEVAAFSLQLGRKGVVVNNVWTPNPHVTVIEELSEGSTKSGKALKGESVAKLASLGRKIGISLVATTQRPKKAADDVITQASAVSYGRLDAADVNYLADVLDLNGRLVDAIKGPDNEGLPPHHFILTTDGEPWDGAIHKLDKRTVSMFE